MIYWFCGFATISNSFKKIKNQNEEEEKYQKNYNTQTQYTQHKLNKN